MVAATDLPPPEEEVRNAAGAGHGLEVEPVEQVLVGGPESLPSADLDRRDGDERHEQLLLPDPVVRRNLDDRRLHEQAASEVALGDALPQPVD